MPKTYDVHTAVYHDRALYGPSWVRESITIDQTRHAALKIAEGWPYPAWITHVDADHSVRILHVYPVQWKHPDSRRHEVLVRCRLHGNELWNAVADRFERSCRCTHDCCGHWFSYVVGVKRVKGNEYRVAIQSSQNV